MAKDPAHSATVLSLPLGSSLSVSWYLTIFEVEEGFSFWAKYNYTRLNLLEHLAGHINNFSKS